STAVVSLFFTFFVNALESGSSGSACLGGATGFVFAGSSFLTGFSCACKAPTCIKEAAATIAIMLRRFVNLFMFFVFKSYGTHLKIGSTSYILKENKHIFRLRTVTIKNTPW